MAELDMTAGVHVKLEAFGKDEELAEQLKNVEVLLRCVNCKKNFTDAQLFLDHNRTCNTKTRKRGPGRPRKQNPEVIPLSPKSSSPPKKRVCKSVQQPSLFTERETRTRTGTLQRRNLTDLLHDASARKDKADECCELPIKKEPKTEPDLEQEPAVDLSVINKSGQDTGEVEGAVCEPSTVYAIIGSGEDYKAVMENISDPSIKLLLQDADGNLSVPGDSDFQILLSENQERDAQEVPTLPSASNAINIEPIAEERDEPAASAGDDDNDDGNETEDATEGEHYDAVRIEDDVEELNASDLEDEEANSIKRGRNDDPDFKPAASATKASVRAQTKKTPWWLYMNKKKALLKEYRCTICTRRSFMTSEEYQIHMLCHTNFRNTDFAILFECPFADCGVRLKELARNWSDIRNQTPRLKYETGNQTKKPAMQSIDTEKNEGSSLQCDDGKKKKVPTATLR